MNPTSGVWVPADRNSSPEAARVRQWVSRDWADREDLDALDDLDVACLQKWIRLPAGQWLPVLEPLSADELVHFIRLIALAESNLPGCEAAEQSAAIHAFHVHKEKWGKPEKSLLRWIRRNSDNRFLPYGPVL